MTPGATASGAMASRVIVSLRVAATPERAFAVFTNDIALWWQPSPLFQLTPRSPGTLAFEPRVGGRFTETLPDGKVFEIGRISVWEPGSRLVFGWRQATFARDQTTEVEVRFELAGDQTRVTVEHRGWDGVPAGHVARHTMPDAVLMRRLGEWWQRLLAAHRLRTAAPEAQHR
ncbi:MULTISPECIES: SRPBCC family protein [unclassified Bradyrhizobium]|uniref:SRPBCC family protein n=1 Tax=unclassified Bradyrhizobium TaxID=2631580 RepID=UPI0020133B8B|nr:MULTISPECIES: SRPBCC family protein [unclassified Bradyrhizobium]